MPARNFACKLSSIGKLHALKDSSVVRENFSTLRKSLPKAWSNNSDFLELVAYGHDDNDKNVSYTFIEERLQSLGYADNNDRMVHDYIQFMIQDILTAEGTPFATNSDMKSNEHLMYLFHGQVPDLIVKSDKSRNRPKPMIVDVLVNVNDHQLEAKRDKYDGMLQVFDYSIITRYIYNYYYELPKIMSEQHVDYFHKHFNMFLEEYNYWITCVQARTMYSRSDINIQKRVINALAGKADGFDDARVDFIDALTGKARAIRSIKGI